MVCLNSSVASKCRKASSGVTSVSAEAIRSGSAIFWTSVDTNVWP